MSLYGADYQSQNQPLILALCTGALISLIAPIGNLIAASSQMWLGALMNFGWSLIYVSTVYWYFEKTATGVMTAFLIAYVVHTAWTILFALYKFKNNSTIAIFAR